jgi:hypothetical protein
LEVIDKLITFADEINYDWDEEKISCIKYVDADADDISSEKMDHARMYRLCHGKQHNSAEIKTAEAECNRRPEGLEGCIAAYSERIYQPERGLPALEGFGRIYCY